MVTLGVFAIGLSMFLSCFFIGVIIAIPGILIWPLLIPAGGFMVLGSEIWTYMTTNYWIWAVTAFVDLFVTYRIYKFYRGRNVAQKQQTVAQKQRREPQLTI